MSTFPGRNPVIVQVTIDQMRHQLLTHLADYGGVISQALADETDRAFAAFDFKAHIHAEVEKHLPMLLSDVVKRAVQQVLYSEDMRRRVERAALDAVAQMHGDD